MIDELEAPGRLRIRLRVPAMRADAGDPGTVTVDVQLGEPPQLVDGCQLLELVFGWGASSDSGVVTSADAGSATIRLVDPLRLFDPANSSSSFAGIGTTIRVLLNGLVAFRGRVDDVQHDLTIATLQCTDGVAALAAIQFVETSVPAETTSARITRILDLAAWPADRRDIGGGGRSLQAGTVSADAWSELLKVTRNELGTLWLTPDGRVAWRSRTTAWLGAPLTEHVVNGSFEQMRDPAAQYPWPSGWAAHPSELYMQTTNADPRYAIGGTRALYVGTNGVGHFAYQQVALTPGASYTLSAYGGRYNTYAANPAVGTVNLTDPGNGFATIVKLSFSNQLGEMQRKSAPFVAPAGGLVQLEVGTDAAYATGQDFYFDLVSIGAEPYVAAMTFGCEPSDAFIGTMTTRADQSDLVNVLSAARRGGTQATRIDSTSLAVYGRHSHVQNDLELATDDERNLWSDFYIIRQANPAAGIAGFDTRPDSAALSKLLALQLGAIVRIYDEHHGPVIDRRARWLGAKWKVTPSYVEIDAVVGEDASIRQVSRTVTIDTPAEWLAAASGPWRGDLLVNGSFEDGTNGWQNIGGSFTIITDASAPAGTKVARLAGVLPVVAWPGIQITPRVKVIPGVVYRVRAWAKYVLGAGVPFEMAVYGYSLAGNVVGSKTAVGWTSAEGLAGGSYRDLYWQCPIDGATGTLVVQLYLNHGGPGDDHAWLVDDVTIKPGNIAYREPGAAPYKLPSRV